MSRFLIFTFVRALLVTLVSCLLTELSIFIVRASEVVFMLIVFEVSFALLWSAMIYSSDGTSVLLRGRDDFGNRVVSLWDSSRTVLYGRGVGVGRLSCLRNFFVDLSRRGNLLKVLHVYSFGRIEE